jgi:type III pantothenate kinase
VDKALKEPRPVSTLEPADALLVIDVGNSRVGLGIWDADGLHSARRLDVNQPDGWRPVIEELWHAMPATGRAVVLGTVNPSGALPLQTLVEEITEQAVHRVRDDVPLPVPLAVENELEVGVDRVCAAAAAHERLGTACAVASFGTAMTVDCVAEDGRFLGGAILPGYEMACNALHEHTAQLPRVGVHTPKSAFGRNTHDAIVGGVAFGMAGALREIVERFATELGEWPPLVITGGNAPLIAELTDFVDAVVPDLCLMGIALAYRRAAGQA